MRSTIHGARRSAGWRYLSSISTQRRSVELWRSVSPTVGAALRSAPEGARLHYGSATKSEWKERLSPPTSTPRLQELERPNVKTQQHDILNEPLPEGDFDLVHARWILHHLPTPEVAISRMVSALRPGGWLLLEEVDFFPVHASENTDYRDFMTALVNTVVKASGRDCFWARALPRVVAEQGLSNVSGEGDFSLLQGGSEIAEFFTLTAEQMREQMLGTGTIDAEKMDRALNLLSEPSFWAFGGGGVPIWGRRPGGALPCD
jgi:SAM-dependent methyltransferase